MVGAVGGVGPDPPAELGVDRDHHLPAGLGAAHPVGERRSAPGRAAPAASPAAASRRRACRSRPATPRRPGWTPRLDALRDQVQLGVQWACVRRRWPVAGACVAVRVVRVRFGGVAYLADHLVDRPQVGEAGGGPRLQRRTRPARRAPNAASVGAGSPSAALRSVTGTAAPGAALAGQQRRQGRLEGDRQPGVAAGRVEPAAQPAGGAGPVRLRGLPDVHRPEVAAVRLRVADAAHDRQPPVVVAAVQAASAGLRPERRRPAAAPPRPGRPAPGGRRGRPGRRTG